MRNWIVMPWEIRLHHCTGHRGKCEDPTQQPGTPAPMIQPTHEKQAFLRLVLKSAAWRHGELQTRFQEPFENLKPSNQLKPQER